VASRGERSGRGPPTPRYPPTLPRPEVNPFCTITTRSTPAYKHRQETVSVRWRKRRDRPFCRMSYETVRNLGKYKNVWGQSCTASITFRRHGGKQITKKWQYRRGSMYYEYAICRYCFDIRVRTNPFPPHPFLQTHLCSSCHPHPFKSSFYWDAVYKTLLAAPLLGEKFEHFYHTEMQRLGLHSRMPKMGQIQGRNKIQGRIRDNRGITARASGAESDTVSDTLSPDKSLFGDLEDAPLSDLESPEISDIF